MNHQKAIMNWLKNHQKELGLSAASASETYQRYTAYFGEQSFSHPKFGRVLTSQGIVPLSVRRNGKVIKAYSAARNPDFNFTCPYCNMTTK